MARLTEGNLNGHDFRTPLFSSMSNQVLYTLLEKVALLLLDCVTSMPGRVTRRGEKSIVTFEKYCPQSCQVQPPIDRMLVGLLQKHSICFFFLFSSRCTCTVYFDFCSPTTTREGRQQERILMLARISRECKKKNQAPSCLIFRQQRGSETPCGDGVNSISFHFFSIKCVAILYRNYSNGEKFNSFDIFSIGSFRFSFV